LKHDRDLEDDGVKKVKPSVCAWPKQDIFHPEHLTGMVHETWTYEKHDQRVTVWNVTFSEDVPGGPGVMNHSEKALMEAIECYAQFKADACKDQQVSLHDMPTVNCQQGSNKVFPVSNEEDFQERSS
jgi:hypothetical protein